MTYDTTGKRRRTENLAGQATTTAWDCCHKVYADGKGPKYEYDVHGQLARRTWARGIDTFYTYDGWGNLTNTTYSDTTPTIALSYDAMGRQTSATDAAGTTIFSYDAFGANTNETVVGVAGTNILERFHDTFGRDAGYALNGVRQSTLGYNPATGRLATMLAAGSDMPFAWNYVAGSDLKSSLAYPNGLTASWTYGNRGELLEVDNALPSGSVSKYIYTYDAAGRRVACAKSGSAFATPDTCAYRYNTRSELTNAVAAVDSSYRYGYQFDDIGNREISSERGTNSVYTANNLNQYTAVDDFVPQFDDDGNQMLVKTATGIWQVVYNGENRPVLWMNGDTSITMSYDRMGRRVAKNDQRFVYDGYLQIADNACNVYVWDPTEPVATRPLEWKRSVLSTQHSALLFYTNDGNKNIGDVIAADGSLAAHYEYTPFGLVVMQTGESSFSNAWRFSSEFAEDDTATIGYNYRYYEPFGGCWMTRDLIGVIGGSNEYGFLANCPLSRCDIMGLLATGDSVQVKEGGFLGLFQNDCGTIVIDKFEAYFGVDPRYAQTGNTARNFDLYGVDITMSFSRGVDFTCCCKSGQYRWQQKIVRDDFHPSNEGRLDGDPRFLPYYNGGGDRFRDVPGQYPYQLQVLKVRESATVMFSTCIVCQQQTGKDKTMGCVSWGFEMKRVGLGYRIYRKP